MVRVQSGTLAVYTAPSRCSGEVLGEQDRAVEIASEIAPANFSEALAPVVGPQRVVALGAVEPQFAGTCAAALLAGPAQQVGADVMAGVSAVNHQAVNVRSEGVLVLPDGFVAPE